MSLVKDILLDNIVKSWFFDDVNLTETRKINKYAVEFIITPNCSKSCGYCLSGDTRIRMADMTEKPIKDIKKGDLIIAFDEYPNGAFKENSTMKVAEVVRTFHRKAKVLELIFEDNSVLYITENHPILVRRNAYEGHRYDFRPAGKVSPGRKVYCISKKIDAIYEEPDIYNKDYILGYITGMTLGDGTLKDYRDKKQGVFFRIAVKDEEILERFGEYLDIFGIEHKTQNFQISKKENKWIDAICSGKLSVYEAIKNIIDSNFKVNKSVNYYKGFLSSIYDAEGHIDKDNRVVRICNTDYNIIQEICDGLDAIGVKWVLEEAGRTVNFDKKWNVRIVMGEALDCYKFIKLVSPAVPRKGIENFLDYPLSRKKLLSVRVAEELGEIDVYNLETTTHTYFANNIAVHNCYLQKHREDIYPDSIVDNTVIMDNMKKFLNYLKLNKKVIPMLDLFSGEIWGEDFGYEILNTLLEFSKEYQFTKYIAIATNMDFLFTPHGEEWMRYFISEFKKLGVSMNISASIDGAMLEDEFRPQNNKYDIKIDYDFEYYDKIFSFQSEYGYGFHPMVSAKSCKYWCENFDWYVSMVDKYYKNYQEIMLLEVRDDNWEKEDIEYYKKFINHVIDYKLNTVFKGDKYAFAQYLTKIRSYRKIGNNNIGIYSYNNRLNCTVNNTLFIRLGDLAVVPCHRTAYNELIYGYLDIDGKDMTAKANNVELMLRVLSDIPNNDYEKCKDCVYKQLCMKGCLGSQYETNKNMFEPCESVCEMLKTKIDILVECYDKLGIYEILKEFPETNYYYRIIEDFKKRKSMSGSTSDSK